MQQNSLAALLAVIALAVMGLLFSSQTIEVSPQAVQWHFAGRFWRSSLDRALIASVRQIEIALWRGWGIRMMRRGCCYSVSGRKGVELTLTSGRRIVLGTDRPQQLVTALMA